LILNSLIGSILGTSTILFISLNFSLLLVITLILNQLQGEHKKMKTFLKSRGYRDDEDFMEKLLKRRGMIDSRILWIPIALIILYLIYKAFIQ